MQITWHTSCVSFSGRSDCAMSAVCVKCLASILAQVCALSYTYMPHMPSILPCFDT